MSIESSEAVVQQPDQNKPKRRQLSDRAIVNLFIWPALILLIAMNVFPLFYSLYLGFTDYSAITRQQPQWIAFENFAKILSDELLWKYFATTGRFALLSVGLQTIVGFGLAMLVNHKFKGSGLLTTLILIPMMISPVVVGLFWKLMYNPTFGFFNFLIGYSKYLFLAFFVASLFAAYFILKRYLQTKKIYQLLSGILFGVFGIVGFIAYFNDYSIFGFLSGFFNPSTAPDMLASRFAGTPVPGMALWAVVIVDVWMWSPFVMLLVLSGLKAIPDYLYEAAAIDRASSWFQFWRITLPQVAPLLLIAILFRTIEAFKAFDLIMGMTGGGPGDQTELISVNLYRQAFLGQWRTGRASALAYIILIIIIAVSNLYIRYLNQMKGED
jgi:multiple sugar transport system permease protein